MSSLFALAPIRLRSALAPQIGIVVRLDWYGQRWFLGALGRASIRYAHQLAARVERGELVVSRRDGEG